MRINCNRIPKDLLYNYCVSGYYQLFQGFKQRFGTEFYLCIQVESTQLETEFGLWNVVLKKQDKE
jgi:hypothetical protein